MVLFIQIGDQKTALCCSFNLYGMNLLNCEEEQHTENPSYLEHYLKNK